MTQPNTTVAQQQSSTPAKKTTISSTFGIPVVGVIGSNFLQLFNVSKPSSFFASYAFAFLVSYWFGPRPGHSFRQHVLDVAVWMTLLHAALWGLPQMLSSLVSGSLAHGLSFFFVAMGVYWWWKPFSSTTRKKGNFILWATGSLICAAFYGWVRGLFL